MDVQKLLLVSLRMLLSSNYRMIRRLKLFDPGYFLHFNRDSSVSETDPLWDYLKKSGDSYYDSGELSGTWSQLGDPHPLFDTGFYLLNYFPDGLPENPLVNYLKTGWQEGFQPGPFVEPDIYRRRSTWREGDPLTHYTHFSAASGVSPGLGFDIDWYLDNNPVLAPVKGEIIKHYKVHGAKIGKSPLPVFDPEYYISRLNDAKAQEAASIDPLSHYLCGIALGKSTSEIQPCSWFTPGCYLAESGPLPRGALPLTHYTNTGVYRGLVADPRINELVKKPLISVIVPVYNPEPAFLNNCLRSVLFQSYPYWELCLVDDCSDHDGIRELLEIWSQKDSRIKVKYLKENGGIATATNSAVSLASGDFLGFLDNDDELAVDCLYRVAEVINESGAELIYSDEDLIGDDGTQLSIFRKPDFNPELLLSHNYITHFVVTRRDLFDKVGGLDSLTNGAQDFDLMLKLTEKTDKIHHIAEILYHWRASETSTSINHGQKNYAHDAGKKALEDALKRRKVSAELLESELNFYYRIRPTCKADAVISVLLWIPALDEVYLSSVLSLLSETTYENACFIVISPEESCQTWLQHGLELQGEDFISPRLKVVNVASGTGKAAALNTTIEQQDCEYLAFVELPIETIQGDWLEQLAGCFSYRDCALVCGRFKYGVGDGPSYSMPVIEDSSVYTYYNFLILHAGHVNGMHCSQEIPCCGWEITMLRRSTYSAHGGFNSELYPDLFAMADLALRVRQSGGRVIYSPEAVVDLGEVEQRVPSDPLLYQEEKNRFQRRWNGQLNDFSVYYNEARLADKGIDKRIFKQWFLGKDSVSVV
jgi:glycosyltransferase involved in cell wall biosynthesis